ncbi:hypothetical protein [Legionella sp. km772]|uniref:hypothetical protein n=1 Tax=Legionella sp. km772 TaxID=2498111 RepID=UPI000F8D1A34|nr:hypothetical protein [Legionella sp. km772]RUR06177.1 hypothetical protein ELY15_13490 [Legionella sp. km772]
MTKKHHQDITRRVYLHATRNTLIGLALILLALYIGMCGYHFLEHLSWIDSFLNASMILSGMGPVSEMKTEAGKLFAGCYALFSGLTFIAIVVIILSPAIHHFFRKIHLETGKERDD